MLSRAQLVTLGVLLLLPVLLFAGIGVWTLWETNRLIWLSWSIPLCWGASWLLFRLWGKPLLGAPPELDVTHWTPRDEEAAEIIRHEQERAKDIPPAQLVDTTFYSEQTLELARKIGRRYHPKAADPLGSLTVLEVLAATQLVSEDLEQWFQNSVPASHLITVSQWQLLSQAPQWWNLASNAGWIASIAMNPANLGRYFVSKFAVDPISKQLQGSLLTAFYMLYLRQVGYYLIEMNSGRLRGGAAKYRQIMRRMSPGVPIPIETPANNAEAAAPVAVSIAVIGQVKAGKSSLVNSLLGAQQAAVDVLPSTRAVQRYRLQSTSEVGASEALTLLDTPGYGEAGASPEQFEDTLNAVRLADLVLVVMDGKSPAKQADQRVLSQLAEWYRAHPQFKPPPMVGVVSKIDLLSPVREWQPPYEWTRPMRIKEESIAGAVDYVREQLGAHFDAVVPVCTDRSHDRIYGIAEFLLPAMTALLTEARAVSLLKTLHLEQDRGKFLRIFDQALQGGRQLIELWRANAATRI